MYTFLHTAHKTNLDSLWLSYRTSRIMGKELSGSFFSYSEIKKNLFCKSSCLYYLKNFGLLFLYRNIWLRDKFVRCFVLTFPNINLA